MNIFDKIQNDKEIIDLYEEISQFEDLDRGCAHHNLDHVKNVAEIVDLLLTKLGYEESFVEEAKIAAILHDAGAIEGKNDHAMRSYRFAKDYIRNHKIKLKNEEQVLESIKIHSDGFDSDNIIALALILADKLDIKHNRLAKEGYNVDGMRQMQYIRDILVDIKNNKLEIKFVCDSNINIRELEEFYFINKVFKAIRNFSIKMNLEYVVFLNDEIWSIK